MYYFIAFIATVIISMFAEAFALGFGLSGLADFGAIVAVAVMGCFIIHEIRHQDEDKDP